VIQGKRFASVKNQILKLNYHNIMNHKLMELAKLNLMEHSSQYPHLTRNLGMENQQLINKVTSQISLSSLNKTQNMKNVRQLLIKKSKRGRISQLSMSNYKMLIWKRLTHMELANQNPISSREVSMKTRRACLSMVKAQ